MNPIIVTVRLPRVPSGLVANLVGLLGLLGVAVALGGLLGNWWVSLLAGSVFAVGLSYIAQSHQVAEDKGRTKAIRAA